MDYTTIDLFIQAGGSDAPDAVTQFYTKSWSFHGANTLQPGR